ncbi:MAG: alanine racemase [Candidatus Eremiobacteraeota bacterium]|nr:alanine racemase [Candidatus Eremiobacteraeota bacterium]
MQGKLQIDVGALRENARQLHALVDPTAIAFAVKSNAYGHGLEETALAIEPAAVRFCVYGVDEAVALRAGGIHKPILIMGPVAPSDLDAAVSAKAAIALWDTKSYVREVVSTARRRNARVPVHVKVNSGLNRLGLSPADAADAIEDYLRLAEIEIAGVFSHLASAEELDSPFTLTQLATFERSLAPVQGGLAKQTRAIRHIAASAAAMLWPQTRLDMVRVGIALYGLWPSPATREAMEGSALTLTPALSYYSSLVDVRRLERGDPVGYGTTFHAPHAMKIGVVPAGYADGIPRLLSNRGAFIVRGARCPIVGRVAMNMTTIDLSAAPDAAPGDVVTLIGRDGDAAVSADDWAVWAETINYEIVTRLPSELPRDYVNA